MSGWIFGENLQPFVELLAFLAGYTLYDEEYEWVAIEYGIQDTDRAAGKWTSYEFAGTHSLTLHLARNIGSNVVSFRVTSDTAITAELTAQVYLLVMVCSEYTIARHGRPPPAH